jgi:N-acetylglucosamine kinase-like BadF-type ATPase
LSDCPYIIGVDGGGTKTVAWIAPLDDDMNSVVLGRGQSGPGNPRAVGFEVAQANIAAAIEAAFADAKLPSQTAATACFGLAGAGRAIEQQRIVAWGQQRGIARSVAVTGDAEPILAAASPDNCGIALICGTGSLAWDICWATKGAPMPLRWLDCEQSCARLTAAGQPRYSLSAFKQNLVRRQLAR